MNKEQKAILAGGCFWCTEAVFQKVKGVKSVQSGFCGGFIKNPAYREVVQGTTGHAESIEIVYDESVLSFKEIVLVFFGTHDPTTLNRQGYDVGTHYRSAIFYLNNEQKDIANQVIEELTQSAVYENPIVTEVSEATAFYRAEESHDDYYRLNPEQGYCRAVIEPKIKKLLNNFQELVK